VLDKLIFANHAITVTEQVYEKVENLRLDLYRLSFPAQFPAVRIEYVLAEAEPHAVFALRQTDRSSGRIQLLGGQNQARRHARR
jgi:hypothetical protein